MELKELLTHRKEQLEESQNELGFISDSTFLANTLQYLNETKLTDTEDFNDAYCLIVSEYQQIKINAYTVNESGERLQIFIVNEESLSPSAADEEIIVTQKATYEKLFSKAINFVKRSVRKQLDNDLQDSSPSKPLSVSLGSPERLEEIDVVEVFLISATVTAESRGEQPSPRRMEFDDELLSVSWTEDEKRYQKEITIIRRLIDINFLYDVTVSQGNREPLTVDFSGYYVECIQAAMEKNYESWLCVLPAPLLVDLYRKHSSRMLEKNVRSFLQLNNSVNRGIQDTIRNSPEKFIAYNNGLTITATGKDFFMDNDKTYIRSLTDFQIVNGGQTTATIYFSNKSGLDISNVRVMAKINVAKDASQEELEDLITRISAYSNAQSKVSSVDLRSRNSQLVKLKTLSESVLTPSGKKWFFERARGEFNTLVRKNPSSKAKLDKEYPRERRFTKEELAKFYTAWGDTPHLVKKGGEKVFRLFIENISGEGKPQKEVDIDRNFYEETVAKVILFRTLEKLHGSGPNNPIGQLRSAVVPYTIAIIYKYTTGDKSNLPFKLTEIWKQEGLDEQFCSMATDLMVLVNELIKKYSTSDDYGEHSKKQELWNKIRQSWEVADFADEAAFQRMIKRYCGGDSGGAGNGYKTKVTVGSGAGTRGKVVAITKGSVVKKKKSASKSSTVAKRGSGRSRKELPEVDFAPAYNNIRFFTSTNSEDQKAFTKALDFIVNKYKEARVNKKNILSEFAAIRKRAVSVGYHNSTVFPRIGKQLSEGFAPDIDQIEKVAGYIGRIK